MSDVLHADVVVVGAGVSGLALAIHLGRQGIDVCLVDKLSAPRDKVCGEGIMPLGLRSLTRLGIDLTEIPGATFDGLDYLSVGSSGLLHHPLRFPPGVVGRGLRRTVLVTRLEREALAYGGVRIERDEVRGLVREGGRVVELQGNHMTYRARVFVAADGVNSRMKDWCEARAWKYAERMALRRHYRLAPARLPSRVQVGLLGSHDLYLTPVGNGELLATTLTDRVGYRAIVDDYDGFLRSGPYASLFADAEPASETLAWYHPLFHARHYVPGGVLLLGDAGGGIDPCLGMGMSLALYTAVHAADTAVRIMRAAGERSAAERDYARERKRLFLHYHHFGRVFRTLVGTPQGARTLMWAMARMPRMANRLLAIVADMRPWRSLVWGSSPGPQSLERRFDSQADGTAVTPLR